MKKLVLAGLVGVLFCSATAFGQGDVDRQLQDLRKLVADQQKMISQLMGRIGSLESGRSSGESSAEPEKTSWFDSIELGGDLRFRHEYINDDAKDRDRHRQRIRARIGLDAEVNDEVDVRMQLSTAGSEDFGGDPVSGNQTLGGLWSGKEIWLTQASFDYHPEWAEGLSIIGGKIKRPFITPGGSELIWDGDVNPEGGVVKYTVDATEDLELTGQLYGFWSMERSTDVDSGLFGVQAAGKYGFEAFDDKAHVGGGVSWYRYSHETDGGGALLDLDAMKGFDGFSLLEAFAEFGFKVSDMPVTVYVDYVTNLEADDDDMGWAVGIKVGKAKKPGEWEAKYIYKHVEMNSVFATFTDSDFGGGGTSVEGHEFGAKVNLAHHWDLGSSLFVNTSGIASGEVEEDYLRFQIDLMFKF